MKRTQIYLSDEQWRDLSRTARIEGAPVAELIRRAVDRTYRGPPLAQVAPAAVEAWAALAGSWSDRNDLPNTERYVRELRKDGRLE